MQTEAFKVKCLFEGETHTKVVSLQIITRGVTIPGKWSLESGRIHQNPHNSVNPTILTDSRGKHLYLTDFWSSDFWKFAGFSFFASIRGSDSSPSIRPIK